MSLVSSSGVMWVDGKDALTVVMLVVWSVVHSAALRDDKWVA